MSLHCALCPRVFDSNDQLRRHKWDNHTTIANVVTEERRWVVSKIEDEFRCPVNNCPHKCKTLRGFTSHIEKKHNGSVQKAQEEDSEVNEEGNDMPLMPIQPVPKISELETEKKIIRMRTHDHSILHACSDLTQDEAQRERTILLTEAMKLRPLALIDAGGVEENTLASNDVIQRILLMKGPIEFSRPQKRLRVDEGLSRSVFVDAHFGNVLQSGPYAKLLGNRTYTELTPDACKLLNDDWSVRPQMRYFSAKALAGAVLFDPDASQALLVNTVEVYGRTPFLDCHHERYQTKKGVPAASTLPPPTGTRYREVWATSSREVDGVKLSICTMVLNALITSSIRVDRKVKPETGPSTAHFALPDVASSSRVQIFVDEESWNDAKILAEDPSATCTQSRDLVFQMRQIRSKFHKSGTYQLSRASSVFTNSHRLQPYTVFTYNNYDNGNPNTSGKLASVLFQHVAMSVLRKGSAAVLEKDTVNAICGNCSPGNQVYPLLNAIVDLFDGKTELAIMQNTPLCSCLKSLATLLSSSISAANKSVEIEIAAVFSD